MVRNCLKSMLIGTCLMTIPVVSAAVSANGYICDTDMSTGFAYDKGQERWHIATFASTKKFVVARGKASSDPWTVTEVGSAYPTCSSGRWREDGFFFCDAGLLGEFIMHSKDLRFEYVYLYGYVGVNHAPPALHLAPEGDDDPALLIGRCTLF